MSGSFEKSVKGGTKIKLAAPKSKYVEHILVATHAGEAGVAEIFRALQNRLRDSTWTIVFKSLIIIHLMIREGEPQVTLKFLADSPSKLAISNFSDVQVQGSNIRRYYTYLLVRAKAYRDTRIDWVRDGQGRLKRQTVDKGLLRETETVQTQISALLKCDLLNNEPENEITLTAFRLLTMDLLVLFHVMNEGTINVLEHYFEMSRYDAERALTIYKNFSKQTIQVVDYLSTARTYENETRLEIPKLKHAPTSLTSSLEEYLNDPDFEINRRQYLAQQEAKKGRKTTSNANGESSSGFAKPATNKKPEGNQTFQAPPGPPPPPKSEPKGPAPDLIDLFDSIEQNQQPMAIQSPPQNSVQSGAPFFQPQQPQQPQGFQPQGFIQNGQSQQNAPFGSLDGVPFGPSQSQQTVQPSFTASSYNSYTQQQQQQQQPHPQQQQQQQHPQQPQQPYSNQPNLSAGISQNNALDFSPFQQQQQQQQFPFATGQQAQSTNPFRQSVMPQNTAPALMNAPPLPTSQPYQSTNPFARNLSSQPSGQSNQSTPFGSPPPQSQPTPFTSPSLQSQSTPFTSQHPQPQASAYSSPTQPLQPQHTGTNPFARTTPGPSTPLAPNVTGSTNPFRQSTFPKQPTGQGWQAGQGSMGGLEHLETVPVFPRPGQGPGSGIGGGQPQGGSWP
ncbi:hypothetical protein MMC07_005783 [Pseudocyphellaria aurata]|nr:hypothetical protein [Pseudocyphellaria aurata]